MWAPPATRSRETAREEVERPSGRAYRSGRPVTPSSCPLCGATPLDASEMLYSRGGDLVCAACHERDQRADELEKQAEARVGRRAVAAAAVSGLPTLAL